MQYVCNLKVVKIPLILIGCFRIWKWQLIIQHAEVGKELNWKKPDHLKEIKGIKKRVRLQKCMEPYRPENHPLGWVNCQSQPLCPSLPPPSLSRPYRTRRWIWNRCTGVWTVLWTRTGLTSRSPARLSRSLRWTSAACSPASSWSLGGTTRPRPCLWPPFSRGRGVIMGVQGAWVGH